MTKYDESLEPDRFRDRNDRRAYIRDWIARRMTSAKIAGSGLAGAVMTMPDLAPAQGQSGFVDATAIDGVSDAEIMPDGSAELTMDTGATISVPARDVRTAANGEIMVSERLVDVAADAVAASGGAGAGAGVGGLAAGLGGAAVAGVAAGGGGSDSDDGGPGDAPPPIINAEALSDDHFSLGDIGAEPPGDTDSVTVTVTDGDGNETLLDASRGDDSGWTAAPRDGAELPQGDVTVTVTSEDADGEEIESTSTDVIIDTEPPNIAIDDTGVGGEDVLNIAEQGAGITVTGTTDAEDGQEVTVTLTQGGTEIAQATATANDGAWSADISAGQLAAITDGNSVAVAATIEDAAGNPAETPATATFDADLAGPAITIGDISGDNVIGLGDVTASGGLDITGTTSAAAGREVTLSLDGQTYTGTVSDGGSDPNTWSVTAPQSALQALQTAAGSDAILTGVAVSATVTDAAGNPAQAAKTIDADFNGPSIAIDPIAGDNMVNAAESKTDVAIEGTTTNVGGGATVSVTVGGADLGDVQTDQGGSWAASLPQADAAALADGATVDVTADVTDPNGLTASNTVQLAADFTAPAVTIGAISDDDVINDVEGGQPLTISGSSSGAKDGQMVTLGVPGLPDQMAAVDGGGNWSLDLTAGQTGQLVSGRDGASLDITANLSDAAGNPAPEDTRSVDVDLTGPSVTIDPLAIGGDGVLNIAESGTALDITGSASDTDEVTVSVNGTTQSPATVDGNGTWTVTLPAATLGGLPADGTVDITAKGTDTAGNTGQDSGSFDTDLTAPAISVDTISAGDTLTLGELADGLTVTGRASADTAGNTVTATIDGTDFTGPVQNDGSWTAALSETELTGLNLADQTDFDLTAAVSDNAGNPAAPATQTLSTDFRPTVTVDPVGEDGAVNLSDVAAPRITGTALGTDGAVTVAATDPGGEILNDTATVDPDGTWTLDVPQATIDALDAGEIVQIAVNAADAAGRVAQEATLDVDVYAESAYAFVNSSAQGNKLTIEAIGLETLDVSSGVKAETTVTFDTAEAGYVEGSLSNIANVFVTENATNAASGEVVLGAITQDTPSLPVDIYEFEISDKGAGPITLDFADAQQGGPTQLQIGTAGEDTLTSTNTDSVLQGKGGDDTLDSSATGADIVLFQPDQAANGTDTVTGFTTGDTFQADVIAFAGASDLRGNGDTVEALSDGGTLGADTGFVIFTTALPDMDAGTLESAFEALDGEASDDVVYFLAGDGADAELARADVNAAGDADLEVMAEFTGIGDLSELKTDNVVLPDPVMTA